MPPPDRWSYQGLTAVLTTRHAKEQALAPILKRELGLGLAVCTSVDTDSFGTFARETPRRGTAREAARAKIEAGFAINPGFRLGLASEGSFGPHPQVPFAAIGQEMVLLVDRETGLELAGFDTSAATNYSGEPVDSLAHAMSLAERLGFPGHGVIVLGCRNGRPEPESLLVKDIAGRDGLAEAVTAALRLCGAAWLEADMRAHRNPTRMAAIARATQDLARRFNSRCPHCNHPGFSVTERQPGLPCAWCAAPTRALRMEVLSCVACGHRMERMASPDATADPGLCDHCNP